MKLPTVAPVIVLSRATLFPGALVPLHLTEARHRQLLSDALHTHRLIAVAMKKPGRVRKIPSAVAGLGLIRVAVNRANRTDYVILQGLARIRLKSALQTRPYRIHTFESLEHTPPPADNPVKLHALTSRIRDLVADRLRQSPPLSIQLLKQVTPLGNHPNIENLVAISTQHFLKHLGQLEDPGQMADLVSFSLLSGAVERQSILETVDLEQRLQQVIQFLLLEIHSPKNQTSDPYEPSSPL